MREEQAVVAEFVHAHGLETDGWVRFLDLVSELGELSKELLKVSDYGKLPLTATDAMKDELGDCMFSLLCLCGVLELDAKDAPVSYTHLARKPGFLSMWRSVRWTA